jgi:protein farnesyltransferase/geranylgeranyltransferase type-1 subunit alpha
MDYMRAVLKADEVSERALSLTTDAVKLNPANYTIWTYRRKLLFATGADLYNELKFIRGMVDDNPKNYQVWHHLQLIMERLGHCDPKDLEFVATQIADDAKNYHAWSYRQWLVEHFNRWDAEVEYTRHLIEGDVRNNSAWNHRLWAMQRTKGLGDPQKLLAETSFVFEMITKAPANDAAWNYLQGICRSAGRDTVRTVVQRIDKFLEAHADCVPALIAKLQLFVDTNLVREEDVRLQCVAICDSLVSLDTIRARYWSYRRSQLRRLSFVGSG